MVEEHKKQRKRRGRNHSDWYATRGEIALSATGNLFCDVYCQGAEAGPALAILLQQEMRAHESEAVLPTDSNPLLRRKTSQWPQLTQLARHHPCIPGTSVRAERVFPTAEIIGRVFYSTVFLGNNLQDQISYLKC